MGWEWGKGVYLKDWFKSIVPVFVTGLLIPIVDFALRNVISQVTPMLFRDALFHSERFLGLNITHTTNDTTWKSRGGSHWPPAHQCDFRTQAVLFQVALNKVVSI
jgi:hypothetical protein